MSAASNSTVDAGGEGGRDEGARGGWSSGWFRGSSLRAQLLSGLAVLLLAALLTVLIASVLWIPMEAGTVPLLVGLGALVLADVVVLVLFGDYLLRRLVLGPIDRMVESAAWIARGDHRRRLEAEGSEELQRLAGSVNEMAARLIRNQELLAENVRSLDDTNRALSEARTELVHAEKLASVGKLAAGIAHEVGNPLGSILGYVEIARRREGASDETLAGIEEEARRIDRIVRGLLDYARPKAAAPRAVDVNLIVESTLELVSSQGRFKDIRLDSRLEEGLPNVRADQTQLQQILVNFLLNAADAIEQAGREGVVWIQTTRSPASAAGLDLAPRSRREDDPEGVSYAHLRRFRETRDSYRTRRMRRAARLVMIEVADNGVGLDPDHLDHIFDPFFTTKEPGKGTGLGLAVAMRLTEEMGGALRALNRSEGGARFQLLLPAYAEEALT